jgi:hypothetical protein
LQVDATALGPDPIAESTKPGTVGWLGAADTVVADRQDELVAGDPGSYLDIAGARVFHHIGQRLGGDEVHGRLDIRRETVGSDVDGHRQRGPAGQLAQGYVEPVVEVGRTYAVRELPKLGDGDRQLLDRTVDGPGRRRVAERELDVA